MSPVHPKRRRFTSDQKATIVRRHLADKVPVSDLCDEYKIQPTMLYNWQKTVFERMEGLFDSGRSGGPGKRSVEARELVRQRSEIDGLRARLSKKDAVIAEISEAYVDIKKARGES